MTARSANAACSSSVRNCSCTVRRVIVTSVLRYGSPVQRPERGFARRTGPAFLRSLGIRLFHARYALLQAGTQEQSEPATATTFAGVPSGACGG
jgi:hypothetical protein